MKFSTVYLLLTLFYWNISNTTGSIIQETDTLKHSLSIYHPGKKDGEKSDVVLVEKKRSSGASIEFYMDVESVICFQSVCKVVSVRLFWNEIGAYKGYELEEGATLEKYEDDLFDQNDYDILDEILATKNSRFKNILIQEIVPIKVEDPEIDGFSGATAIAFNDGETVHGASLTCYTLWHWAQGEIVHVIKKISGNSMDIAQLSKFLKKEEDYKIFAIEQLGARDLYDVKTANMVIQENLLSTSLLKTSMRYFNDAPSGIFFEAMKNLWLNGNEFQKAAAMNSLLNTEMTTSSNYYDGLCKGLRNKNSYRNTLVFLELMRLKNPNSKKVVAAILPLLDKDILKARATYWFLLDQKLSKQQQLRLDDFYATHKNNL